MLTNAELGARRLTKNPQADPPNGPEDFRKLWFQTRVDEANWVADRIVALLGTLGKLTRQPFVDSYVTDNAASDGMHARPVIGGVFVKMLADPAM